MNLFDKTKLYCNYLWRNSPDATAKIKGGPGYERLRGAVSFYQVHGGVLVTAQVSGLPQGEATCDHPVFALHIHSGTACTGDEKDPFADAGAHYNPQNCPHPAHPGDLPPLFSNGGAAWFTVFTDRFALKEVIGRAVIIHRNMDDFMTQPSGNSGPKIACGIIQAK